METLPDVSVHSEGVGHNTRRHIHAATQTDILLTNNERKIIKNILQNELTCSICLDVLKQPTVVNCGHLFCSKCIQDWLNQHYSMSCPICRQYTGKPVVSEWLEKTIENMVSVSEKEPAMVCFHHPFSVDSALLRLTTVTSNLLRPRVSELPPRREALPVAVQREVPPAPLRRGTSAVAARREALPVAVQREVPPAAVRRETSAVAARRENLEVAVRRQSNVARPRSHAAVPDRVDNRPPWRF